MELYEDAYDKKRHFSFGENWKQFLIKMDKERIKQARKSLTDFLGKLKGKSFVDIGCGSGLFSLAAYLEGAQVTSIDVDEHSLECAKTLKKANYKAGKWDILKKSALDPQLSKLGKFDIVYSWGVLHHTGNMHKALSNAAKLVKDNGLLYIAIYNNNTAHVLEGTSGLWLKIKRIYNHSPKIVKKTMYYGYLSYLLAGITATGHNPKKYIKNYKTLRGMDFYTDVEDWLGGYPYEFATSEHIIDHYRKLGLKNIKVSKVRSLGCNEFLFRKEVR